MRIVMVGFGVAAQARLETYLGSPDHELVGVVDIAPARRAEVERAGLRSFADFDAAVRAGSPDLIDVCTPPMTHSAYVESAIRAGCHVICEKPTFLTLEEADRLCARARAAGVVIYPVHNYLFSPHVRLLKECVADGRVGGPTGGRFQVLRTEPAPGVPDWLPRWRLDPAIAGGGIMLDHGTHAIYMIVDLMAGRLPDTVSCTVSGVAGDAGEVEQEVDLRLGYPAADWRVELSWRAPRRETRYRLDGVSGSVEIVDGCATLTGPGDRTEMVLGDNSHDRSHRAWFPAMFDDAVRAIGGCPSRVDALQARGVAAVSAAARRSAQTGRPAPLDEPVEMSMAVAGDER